ncbi:MAG: helix-turn-helix domain-containing protein [Candidatus Auribacterota bacterium]
MQELSEYLKKLRGNLSIRNLSEKTGISNAYLSQLESGKRDSPHPEILKKLARFYGIPVIEILKHAGYLDDEMDEKESYEEKVDRLFLHVINDPEFQYGTRMKCQYDLAAKRFIIEMYEKLTGKKLLG